MNAHGTQIYVKGILPLKPLQKHNEQRSNGFQIGNYVKMYRLFA